MLLCKFCSQERKNENSLRNHERQCKSNPNRQINIFETREFHETISHENQYTKAKKLGLPAPQVSEETREKIRKTSTGRQHTDQSKRKMSDSAIQRGVGGVKQSRWIRYNGKVLGSSYELSLVQDLDANSIKWDTCKRFFYVDPFGKVRTYTPDIYLIDYGVYLDPKNDFLIKNVNPFLGFKDSEKIELVMKQNGIKVLILSKEELTWEFVKTRLHSSMVE